MLDKLVRFCICSQHRVFPLPSPHTDKNMQAVREACTILLREEVIIFSCCSRGLSLIEKKLEEVDFVDEEFLHKKVNKNGIYMRIMVCYRRYSRRYM